MQGEKWLSGTELKGKIVTLIPLRLEHASALVEAASDGELWDLWYTKIPNEETVNGYIELALSEQDAGRSLAFSVIDNETQTIIGTTRLCHADCVK
ncbi:GNAT family N-acetyltransferase, partial [Aliivibrio fischeri]